MPWPYIFFKPGKKGAGPEPSAAVDPAQDLLKPASPDGQPPALKPVPAEATPLPDTPALTPSAVEEPAESSTRTLPAMHGVVLRPPGRTTPSTGSLPIGAASAAARPTTPLKNIEQLMAEADPMHPHNQTGSVRLMKRPANEPLPPSSPPTPAKTTSPITLRPSPLFTQPMASPSSVSKSTPMPTGRIQPPSLTPAPLVSKSAPMPTSAIEPPPKPPVVDPSVVPPPFPTFRPATSLAAEIKIPEPVKADPAPALVARPAIVPPPPPPTIAAPQPQARPVATAPDATMSPPVIVSSPQLPKPVVSANAASTDEIETPFILKPASGIKVAPPNPPQPMPPLVAISRRRAKMTEIARIVLPPKREDTQPLLRPSEASAVVPPAFPVAAMTKRASQPTMASMETAQIIRPPPLPVAASEKLTPETKAPETSPVVDLPKNEIAPPVVEKPITPPPLPESKPFSENKDSAPEKSEVPLPQASPPDDVKSESQNIPEKPASQEFVPPPIPFVPAPTPIPEPALTTASLFPETPKVDPEAHKPDAATASLPKVDPEAHKPTPSTAPLPKIEAEVPQPSAATAPSPQVDPEAHKPSAATASLPKIDPQAHKPEPASATSAPETQIAPPEPPREKREIHLTNGERIAGVVLSETPDIVLIEHTSLGVVSVPRNQIAKRLVEIILINGDRIVGDIMAETSDTLYVRHASLGMLTVPRTQRSTRVVEAILKDGDRILGEVLTETDSFTVIRSATLGTITIPHSKLSMLNRKIEQIELKALPPPPPELKDKSA